MRKAHLQVSGVNAGVLSEKTKGTSYVFEYLPNYIGEPVSVTMPVSQQVYNFDEFPSFFDGLLPEGWQLDNLLKIKKIDRGDFFSQLIAVGDDLVGNVTIKEIK